MPMAPCWSIPTDYAHLPRAAERFLGFVVGIIIVQDAFGGTVEVVELPAAQGPQERRQPDQAEQQGRGDQEQQATHGLRPSRDRRRALPTTTSDELDMATAAISGVTSPATASGTVIVL